jgi:hypothetical protein
LSNHVFEDLRRTKAPNTVLSCFISRLDERALPFFKLLRKSGPFSWTEEAEQAFQELKRHLVSLSILVAPEPGEPLYLYIAAAAEAVSMVLVVERTARLPQGSQEVPLGEGRGPTTTDLEGSGPPVGVWTIHKPVYYVSEVLHEAKTRYLEKHKLLYAVLVAFRKLRHYFQAHKVVVVTSFPLRAVLHNSNATGNIAKWASELAEFQLDFQPRHAVKSQVLADFIVEWTPPPSAPGGPDPDSAPHLRSLGSRSSPSPTGHSSSTGSPASKVAVLGWSLSTQAKIKSSTWCTSSSRPPPTWQSTRHLSSACLWPYP